MHFTLDQKFAKHLKAFTYPCDSCRKKRLTRECKAGKEEGERIHSYSSDACYECLKIHACKMWRPNAVLVLTLRNDCFKRVPVRVSCLWCKVYVYLCYGCYVCTRTPHKFIRCHPEFVSPVMHRVHNVPYVLDV